MHKRIISVAAQGNYTWQKGCVNRAENLFHRLQLRARPRQRPSPRLQHPADRHLRYSGFSADARRGDGAGAFCHAGGVQAHFCRSRVVAGALLDAITGNLVALFLRDAF